MPVRSGSYDFFATFRSPSRRAIFIYYSNTTNSIGEDIMGKPGNTGMRRIIRATRFSAQGFAHAWQHEAAFRQEIALTIVLIPPAIWLGRTGLERFVLIICCVFVLIVELLNSAIEAAIDRFGEEHHELSGRAKDLGSAAVFLSLGIVAATWATVAYLRYLA